MPSLNTIEVKNKKDFYSSHIFHERQMNSCPIGCVGCAVSASTNIKGSIKYSELYEFYAEANKLGVSLKLTKVEGYDPVFVNYADDPSVPFAKSIQDAVDLGHQIITPVCTTGSWKSEKTKWQLEELGKLSNKYRAYKYPSGSSGQGFVLSIPREINPFASNYSFEQHLEKILLDIKLLTVAGNLDVLIYFNNQIEGDYETAIKIKSNIVINLDSGVLSRVKLELANFNQETLPESCFRYQNSILVSDKGFSPINSKTMEWDLDPNVLTPQDLVTKLASVR